MAERKINASTFYASCSFLHFRDQENIKMWIYMSYKFTTLTYNKKIEYADGKKYAK